MTLPFVLLLLDYWPLKRFRLDHDGPDLREASADWPTCEPNRRQRSGAGLLVKKIPIEDMAEARRRKSRFHSLIGLVI